MTNRKPFVREILKLELTVYYLSLKATEQILRHADEGNGPHRYALAACDALSRAPSLLGLDGFEDPFEPLTPDQRLDKRQMYDTLANLADALVPALMEAAAHPGLRPDDRLAAQQAAINVSKLHYDLTR